MSLLWLDDINIIKMRNCPRSLEKKAKFFISAQFIFSLIPSDTNETKEAS